MRTYRQLYEDTLIYYTHIYPMEYENQPGFYYLILIRFLSSSLTIGLREGAMREAPLQPSARQSGNASRLDVVQAST